MPIFQAYWKYVSIFTVEIKIWLKHCFYLTYRCRFHCIYLSLFPHEQCLDFLWQQYAKKKGVLSIFTQALTGTPQGPEHHTHTHVCCAPLPWRTYRWSFSGRKSRKETKRTNSANYLISRQKTKTPVRVVKKKFPVVVSCFPSFWGGDELHLLS